MEQPGGTQPDSPMVCQACGERPAVIHLTQVVDDKVSVLHLCEPCGAERGVEAPNVPANFPLKDFLAQIGEQVKDAPDASESSRDSCSFCSLTYSKFRETGRLGCPHCWVTFEPQLRGLLRRVHGSTTHTGKVYLPADPSASDRRKRLEVLRRKLSRAVDSEDFERAAELRDAINALESE